MKQPLLPLALCLLLPACSVKEDRRPCPCLLSVITTEAFAPGSMEPEAGWRLTVTGYTEAGKIVEERFDAECVQDTLEYPVRKGSVLLSAHLVRGATRTVSGEEYRIPVGEQVEPFFASSETVDASGETVRCVLHPHKQFSNVYLYDRANRVNPFEGLEIHLTGTVCGLDLRTLTPVSGPFRCAGTPVETEYGRGLCFRIPRQREDDLMLDFLDIPLGKLLFENGYDPSAEELPDFSVTIDSSLLTPGFQIASWETITLDVII